MTDELTGCDFPSLEDAFKSWSWFENHNESAYLEWRNYAVRDERIQPAIFFNRRWFPIAEFNGYSTAVYFDADPAPSGNYGQIIAYQHDPDAIYYVSANFTAFLRCSNDLLESNIVPILFLDEFERICHMSGVAELARQIDTGLDLHQRDWR
jgi:cell wall assembly regulator SMI1